MTSLENNIQLNFKGENAFQPQKSWIRSKVICTIGPKTSTVEYVGKLVQAGMNVARLNFSHGDHSYHAKVIANVREYLASSRRMCAIMLDTKGPGKFLSIHPLNAFLFHVRFVSIGR